MRIGMGYDVHRLGKGEDLIIGGVKIPYEYGLIGHSDADVLLHAITDSVLGAAGMGDIGLHFPDTDESYKGADSLELFKIAVQKIRAKGFEIINIDSCIIAQAPKMRPYIDAMITNIAKVAGISKDLVNVKATTEEGLGFTGCGEGISAQAICMIDDA